MRDINKLCLGCMNELNENGGCEHCNFTEKSYPQLTDALPYRTLLEDRYLVGRTLDSNGEGTTYIAYDKVNDSTVRLREYFPEGLCERTPDKCGVRVVSGCEYGFNESLLEFLTLARNLAKMRDLSAILPVFDIFESNNTAYYISEHIESITLGDFLKRNRNQLRWSQARPLFMPLLSTIEALHNAGIVHLGISPDTIIIGRDSRLRLTGFCIENARVMRSSLTPEFFPGFSAIEQYDDEEHRGTWTDIYGFAASLYRTLVGSPPPEAMERAKNDSLIIPAEVTEDMPTYALTALAYALQIYPEDRTADVETFRNEISGSPVVSAKAEHAKQTKQFKQESSSNKNQPVNIDGEDDDYYDDEDDEEEVKGRRGGGTKAVFIAMLLTGVVILAIGALVYFMIFKGGEDTSSDISSIESSSSVEQRVSREPVASTATMITVSNMIGKSVAGVKESELVKDGSITIEVSSVRYDNSYKYGMIIEQSIVGGQNIEKGGKISVIVSLGPQEITIPSGIIGMPRDQAIIELRLLGFMKDNIQIINKEEPGLPHGVVVSTNVVAGAKVNLFDRIIVYVNSYQPAEEQQQEPAE